MDIELGNLLKDCKISLSLVEGSPGGRVATKAWHVRSEVDRGYREVNTHTTSMFATGFEM